MKLRSLFLSTLLALAFVAASPAHEGVELGPDGGRILEFSKDETIHGEVTAKNGDFHIALLDKDKKPISIEKKSLTAISGDRNNPQKLEVSAKNNKFVVPMPKGDDYFVIFQYKDRSTAKPVTARLHYNAENCSGCDNPEWLCQCKPEGK